MQIKISYVEKDFPFSEFSNKGWRDAQKILIENYWSGEKAEIGRHAKAELLWSDSAFYIRFEANQFEPPVVSESPDLKTKTIGLWNRDVCEIFVAPNKKTPEEYFEFEIAPTGEWIDLKIQKLSDQRETDFEYDSGMESAAKIEPNKITVALKIPWKAFGKAPKANDVWRGNLFRCVGSGETRGYLAWQPTKTEKPNFHVPEAFGEFLFVK
jgi:alpha-galactosidase